MIEGKVKGYFLWGQNPAVGSAGARLQRLALARLDWLVVARPGADRERCRSGRTARRSRPASWRLTGSAPRCSSCPPPRTWKRTAASPTRSGCCSGTTRRWNRQAMRAATCGSRTTWASGSGPRWHPSAASRDRLVQDLTWDYPEEGDEAEPDAAADPAGDQRLRGLAARCSAASASSQDDGSTACGCWIYSGCYRRRRQSDRPAAAARRAVLGRAGVGLGLAGEPAASCITGRPPTRTAGRGARQRRTSGGTSRPASGAGHDVPDFEKAKPPGYVPPPGATGPAALAGTDPFIMQRDGKGALFVPIWAEGRPAADTLRSRRVAGAQRCLRAGRQPGRCDPVPGDRRPTRGSTGGSRCRVPLHLHDLPADRAPHGGRHEPHAVQARRTAAGAVLRGVACSWRADRGLENGGWATIITARAAIEARVLVTRRLRPLRPG